jgi:uncharacterized protein YciU (UPF0263 family)|tara:strand:+ start:16429 stop:18708 length:2280 start_codon:yes stop_codon:yes gene_type:complete
MKIASDEWLMPKDGSQVLSRASGQESGALIDFANLLGSMKGDFEVQDLSGRGSDAGLPQMQKADPKDLKFSTLVARLPNGEMAELTPSELGQNFDINLLNITDGGFAPTASFFGSKISLHNSDLVIDHSSQDMNVVPLNDLLSWVEDFESGLVGEAIEINNTNVAAFQDVINGTPLSLEWDSGKASTIVFDIRSLKAALSESLALHVSTTEAPISSGEIFIPQVVPISFNNKEIESSVQPILGSSKIQPVKTLVSDVEALEFDVVGRADDVDGVKKADDVDGVKKVVQTKNNNGIFDVFVPVKVELMAADGGLGQINLIDLPRNLSDGPTSEFSVASRQLEIDRDLDPRSKLLIGLSAPKGISVRDLPDFVKFDISAKVSAKPGIGRELVAPVILEKMVPKENADDLKVAHVRDLILAIKEMSTLSDHEVNVVTKNVSTVGGVLKLLPSIGVSELLERLQNDITTKSNGGSTDEAQVAERLLAQTSLEKVQKSANLDFLNFTQFKDNIRIGPISSSLAINANYQNFLKANLKFSDSFFANKNSNAVSSVSGANSSLETIFTEIVRGDTLSPMNTIVSESNQLKREPASIAFWSSLAETQISLLPKLNGTELAAPNMADKISLYNAQYASRIGMMIVDKIINGQENFEFQLEPESFGKIKVNVFLDKQALDVRMVAETAAAASLLRTNEEALSQIAGQNGMKLLNFSVGTQAGFDQQRNDENKNKNKTNGGSNSALNQTQEQAGQTSAEYRNSTGLNLIA